MSINMSTSGSAVQVRAPSPRTGHEDRGTVNILGLPLSVLTFEETLGELERRIEDREPGFWITANLNYAMLTSQVPRLREVNQKADMILADGMPLVWASRLAGQPLPQRVTGADLTTAICECAAKKGYRLFLLGAAPGVGATAAARLRRTYPDLQIAGVDSPPFREQSQQENDELISRIRSARTDVLLVAFGQPKGEIWLAENIDRLRTPVAIQIGASIDFAAGTARRAPRFLQKLGLEWAFRLYQEPRRLAGRYASNIRFLAKSLIAARTQPTRCQDDLPRNTKR